MNLPDFLIPIGLIGMLLLGMHIGRRQENRRLTQPPHTIFKTQTRHEAIDPADL